MKKLLMLLAITFAFTFANAQSTLKKSKDATSVESKCNGQKKSCDKSGTKKSCSGASAKSCSGSKSGKSCCGGSKVAYSKLVSPKDFVEYMKRFPAEQVVDIRTKAEIKENGMIEGAKNIDFKASYFKEEMLKLDKDKAIMIYCRSGNRSGQAAKLLKAWGFKKIYDMEGGYNAYLKAFPRK